MKPAFTNALYYPGNIQDEVWLKTAILFWDSISTVMLNEAARPNYNTQDLFYLSEIGFLSYLPFEGVELSYEMIDYIDSEKILNQCFSVMPRNHVQKKVNDEWKHRINLKRLSFGLSINESLDYYLMPDFAAFRMTLLGLV